MHLTFSPRTLLILAFLLLLLASALTFSTAAYAAPEQQDPPLSHKSALGLMPPAYGAPSARRVTLAQPNAITSGPFNPFVVYPSGSWPEAVAAGEFSGDSLLDAALTTSYDFDPANDNQLHFFTQTGSATLAHTLALAAGTSPIALASGDFNRDGRADLAAINQNQDTLSIFLQQPGGAWAAQVTYPAGSSPDGLAVGDFNGDLRQDIAVSHAVSQNVGLYYQQADGTFAAPVYFDLGSAGFNDLAAGDLNGDGYADLAVLRGAGYHTSQVAIFYQQNRTFGAPAYLTAQDGGFLTNGLALGDVTGDGRDDVVVTAGGNTPNAFVNVFTQQPNGTLATTPVVYPAFDLPEAVRIGDVNHDGRNDVIAVHAGWLSLSVYLQQADGTLPAYERYPLPYRDYYHPDSLALADVSGDGALDVLIANHSSVPAENGLVVLINTGGGPTSQFTVPVAPAYITTSVTTLQGTASTASGTLQISTDGGLTWDTQPAAHGWSYTWNVPSADGSYILLSRVTDAAGKVQSPPGWSQAIVDRSLPLGSLSINSGAAVTQSTAVTLSLNATDLPSGVCLVQLRNVGTGWNGWIAYTIEIPWELQSGSGERTVEAQFQDCAGNQSQVSSDSILLSPPTSYRIYLPLVVR